jgi:hypothetical protein
MARTESGDDLPVLGWHRKPTDKQVDAAYKAQLLPDEYSEAGFVSWSVDKAHHEEMKRCC